ncbi:MAG: hypothetical protein WBI85_05375, partial [Tepidanaerobacteraceae bacterium]
MIHLRKKFALIMIVALVFSQVPLSTSAAYSETKGVLLGSSEAPQNGSAREIIETTYPQNNQTDVEVKPTIKIIFKFPVEIKDTDKIVLDSGGERYPLGPSEIYLLDDERTLCIDVGRIGRLPLRRGTLYHLTLSSGAVKL